MDTQYKATGTFELGVKIVNGAPVIDLNVKSEVTATVAIGELPAIKQILASLFVPSASPTPPASPPATAES